MLYNLADCLNFYKPLSNLKYVLESIRLDATNRFHIVKKLDIL